MITLLLLAALGLGYVAGRVHEGVRTGGTLDLACRIALAAERMESEVAHARARREGWR